MDKEFGRPKAQCWTGVKIRYENFEEENLYFKDDITVDDNDVSEEDL